MAGLPPYQFFPPGHPAWAQAMMVQQQAQLAAQAQAMAQAQAAQAAAMARQVNPQAAAAAPTGKSTRPFSHHFCAFTSFFQGRFKCRAAPDLPTFPTWAKVER